MRMITYIIRENFNHPGRTVLTLLGGILGIATIVAVLLTISRTDQAYLELFRSLDGQPSLEMVAPGLTGFDGRFAAQLLPFPGVQAVIPRIHQPITIVGRQGSTPALALGLAPADMANASGFALRTGRLPCQNDEILLEVSFAKALGLEVGNVVQLWTPAGPRTVHLVGSLKTGSSTAAHGNAVVVLTLAAAQECYSLPDQINSVQIVLAPEAVPEQVRASLARHIPSGLIIQSSSKRGETAQSAVLAAKLGLAALGAVALVVATFVMLNTFLLNLGERRKQLAILRILGVTRSQVQNLLLSEAAILGVASTLFGVGSGLALASLLSQAMERFLNVPLPRWAGHLHPFLIACGLGPATALAAAWLPVRRASRRSPLQELRNAPTELEENLPFKTSLAGFILASVSIVIITGLSQGWFSPQLGRWLLTPMIVSLLLGCVLVLPSGIKPLLKFLTWFSQRLFGMEVLLALRYLARHPTRTGLTTGVLFVAMVVAIAFGQTVLNTLRDLQTWYSRAIVADFLVRASMPDPGFLMSTALPERLADELRQNQDVATVDKIAFVPAVAEGKSVLVLARSFAPGRPLPLDLREGNASSVLQGVLRGDVVLGSGLAQELQLKVGDSLVLDAAQGPHRCRIAGIVTEYAVGGMALYMEWQTAQKLLQIPGAHVFLVTAREGKQDALASFLASYCQQHHLMLQSNRDLRCFLDKLLMRITGMLWALMALAFLVASFGIVNTITMNIMNGAPELVVLRTLGMKRRQIYKLVLCQAFFTAIASIPPAVSVGILLARTINAATHLLLGQQIMFRLNVPFVVGCCCAALMLGLASALLPARRASRLPIVSSLASS